MVEKGKASKPRAARAKSADNKADRPGAATRKTAGPNVAGPTIVDTRAGWTTPADDKADADKSLIDEAVDEKDNIDAIVSPRTDDPTARIVAGARVRNCAQCLADVFVAPSTFAYFKGRAMPPIWCVQCAMLAAETHGKSSRAGRA